MYIYLFVYTFKFSYVTFAFGTNKSRVLSSVACSFENNLMLIDHIHMHTYIYVTIYQFQYVYYLNSQFRPCSTRFEKQNIVFTNSISTNG